MVPAGLGRGQGVLLLEGRDGTRVVCDGVGSVEDGGGEVRVDGVVCDGGEVRVGGSEACDVREDGDGGASEGDVWDDALYHILERKDQP